MNIRPTTGADSPVFLATELAKTEMRDITYRLPVPGGKILQGKLHELSVSGLIFRISFNRQRSILHVYLNVSKPSVESSVLSVKSSHT